MANKKITALTALTAPVSTDLAVLVDVSDTTDSANGTTKKVALADLPKGLALRSFIVFEFGDGKNSSSLEANQLARVPYVPTGTIVRARIEGDVSGDAVVNILKSTADPPSYSGICASAKPTLSTDIYDDDTTLTGWTTSLAAGNALMAELESVATCKQVTVILEIVKS